MIGERWYPAVILAVLFGAMLYALHADHRSLPLAAVDQIQAHNKAEQEDTNVNQQAGESKAIFAGVTFLDIATLALAVSTFGLWSVTAKSAGIAEKALVDLERAHVFPSVVDIRINDIRGPLVFKIRMRSLGRSPAIIKEVLIKFHGMEPLPEIPDVSGGISQEYDWAIAETEFSDDFISPHRGAQYLYGFIRYEDIFKKEHKSWIGVFMDTATSEMHRAGGDPYNAWD